MASDLDPNKNIDETIAIYRMLVAQNPDSASLHLYLGRALMERNLQSEAVAMLRRAVMLDSTSAEAYGRLGFLLTKQYKLSDGMAALQRAVALMPKNPQLSLYLAEAFHKAGRLNDALHYFRQSVALNPNNIDTLTALLGVQLYSPDYSREQMFADRATLGKRLEASWRAKWPKPSKSVDRQKRLRVGFVSGDLGNHPVGYFLEGALRELRNLGEIDLIVYARDDVKGPITDRIRAAAHAWVPVFALSDDAFEKCIENDRTDILVDLSGHTSLNRLSVFARKPAPIQVTWLGDCATTGLSAIDYILCDPYGIRDDEEKFYVETPWFLPQTRLCFTPPSETILTASLPALSVGYVTFGCFNNIIKMTDAVIAVWARILNRVRSARLMLKSLSFNDPGVRSNVLARFAVHGIAPDRLVLTLAKSREEYLADYNQIDIALDPFPFTGGTTTIDGLWMGVPALTKRGDTMASRQGEGIMHNIGLGDWIAVDENHYVELAVQHAQDLSNLAKQRSELRALLQASPLCDAKLFAKNLQNAFKQMWEKYCDSFCS